jgi:hypothetical protein
MHNLISDLLKPHPLSSPPRTPGGTCRPGRPHGVAARALRVGRAAARTGGVGRSILLFVVPDRWSTVRCGPRCKLLKVAMPCVLWVWPWVSRGVGEARARRARSCAAPLALESLAGGPLGEQMARCQVARVGFGRVPWAPSVRLDLSPPRPFPVPPLFLSLRPGFPRCRARRPPAPRFRSAWRGRRVGPGAPSPPRSDCGGDTRLLYRRVAHPAEWRPCLPRRGRRRSGQSLACYRRSMRLASYQRSMRCSAP